MKEKLENILKEYIRLFCKKQDLEFDFAVLDDYLDVICFGYETFISMSDIVYDIDNKIPKGVIKDWYNYIVENENNISYRTWVKNIKK